MDTTSSVTPFVYSISLLGFLFACSQVYSISLTNVKVTEILNNSNPLDANSKDRASRILRSLNLYDTKEETTPLFGDTIQVDKTATLNEIHGAIASGARAFLREEYTICLIFVFVAFCVKFHILSQFLNLNNFY
jgi:hypothetical protein